MLAGVDNFLRKQARLSQFLVQYRKFHKLWPVTNNMYYGLQ